MSHQDIKDEYKETDGQPEVKQKIRKLQMDKSVKEAFEERQKVIDKALIRKTEAEKEVAKNKMELRKIKIDCQQNS